MDHYLVLILAEVLGQIALTEVAIKGQNRKLLRKFIFQYASEKEELDASWAMTLSLP